ncbi:MAG: 3-keto-disaccharide hydrolase [Pirellulales bacterium]
MKIMIRCVTFSLMLLATFTASAEEKPAEPVKKDASKKETAKPLSLFDGKTLKQWKVLEKDVFEHHGKVEVKNGELHLAKGDPTTGIVYTGKMPKVNYEIALEAKRVEGGDFFCGLTIPINDSHCTLILGGWGGGVTGISNVDNYAAIENETTSFTEFENNQWYKVKVQVTKTHIKAWVDKENIIDLEIGDHKFGVWWEQEHARPLGVANWHTGSALRNITLKKLP